MYIPCYQLSKVFTKYIHYYIIKGFDEVLVVSGLIVGGISLVMMGPAPFLTSIFPTRYVEIELLAPQYMDWYTPRDVIHTKVMLKTLNMMYI